MIDWHKCYGESWSGIIVPESFCHPAKFSRALIRRIYEHAFEEGWLEAGDVVLDPFGGVALGALEAMRRGLTWVGVELEQKFIDLGQQNIDLWNETYGPHLPGWGSAVLLRGDSRNLAQVVAEAGATAAISSPLHGTFGCGHDAGHPRLDAKEDIRRETEGCKRRPAYGSHPGQLGQMRDGGFAEACVSSPPFEGVLHQSKGGMLAPHQQATHGRDENAASVLAREYGNSGGQLGQESGDTFWAASRLIIEQVYQVLRPGGVAIWVTKAFVRKGKRVDFPGQWRELCEACGFVTLHQHRAWLVEDRGAQYDLMGELHERKVERKSFFRRLAEKKGSPPIDWECVLCMQKPT